ncbi:MAG: translation initiation factor IF-2 [Alphaproteobacteria bacterium]|nr:translation initiation factor IF-2 [Alphaproteobacteria bacterium]
MSEKEEKKEEEEEEKATTGKTLSLSGKTLSLKGGTSKRPGRTGGPATVAVEVRRKRLSPAEKKEIEAKKAKAEERLTSSEKESRERALKAALSGQSKKKALPKRRVMTLEDKKAEEELKEETLRKAREKSEQKKKEQETPPPETSEESEEQSDVPIIPLTPEELELAAQKEKTKRSKTFSSANSKSDEEELSYRDRMKKAVSKAPKKTAEQRRGGRITITQALNKDYERDRGPSLAAQRRAREKARMAAQPFQEPTQKTVREVILPETITVQELSNRMAEPGKEVIRALMKMGVMATGTQTIDADTAELIIDEFGHKVRRVTEADVEIGLDDYEDKAEELVPRPPVVTIMGHVDHGKTSLLDALRETDVVADEAGGITQHIGAYQVTISTGEKITFLDTPGHAAFTEMRARGANVTDIVVIVVAANDSIMPQTIEAINHAKAANVPIIVAVNKIDLPDANPTKVKQDLLQHEVVIEEMGGDVQCVEISAKAKTNLDKLEEAIILQAEILEITANPNRSAQGFVIESKMEKGRGSVATVLIQKGTLRIGHVFVAGASFGKVRALIDHKGNHIKEALPGQPVEVLGANTTPSAGDIFNVTKDEYQAREIAEYRIHKAKENRAAQAVENRTSMEQLLLLREEGEKTKLPIVIRADVHGSVGAIIGSLNKMVEENSGIEIEILHSGVGGITESDVILANASEALIIGFNVRANTQARDLAHRDNVEIRYYNVIYNVIDDAKAILTGMLSPTIREEYIGQAEIKQVFNITKVGKVAGCEVSSGTVRRGSKVRLLRDDVVIHEGMLKTLKRFKEEVKDVKEGQECGMAFENYDDIKEGDVIECFEVIEEKRIIE